MNGQTPGPSRPKRKYTDYEKHRPLKQSEIEKLLYCSGSDEDPFVESESEYDPDESSSSTEEEGMLVSPISTIEHVPDIENVAENTVNEDQPMWSDNPDFHNFPFMGFPGLKVQLPSDDPIDFFNLFVTDNFLENIVIETNRYAEELFLSQQTKEKSRITDWKPLTATTLKVFLGLWLHMGNIQINRLQDYWKTDELYNLSCFSNYMSRNRFLSILRCFHFSENREGADRDRLSKIRWLQDFFNKRIDEIYYPNKELSLDESMVLWRGRLIFRQYIKNKKHKFGVKLYVLSEPNGLALKIRIYTGVEKDMQGELGHAGNVVLCLAQNYLLNGHSLYMDNYYNSLSLCKELLLKKTYVTGTLRTNRRGNPSAVTTKKLKKGDVVSKYCSGVGVGKWRDKREVLFISTEFDGELTMTHNKRGEEKKN